MKLTDTNFKKAIETALSSISFKSEQAKKHNPRYECDPHQQGSVVGEMHALVVLAYNFGFKTTYINKKWKVTKFKSKAEMDDFRSEMHF